MPVRSDRKPSANTAITGPVTTRPSMGAASTSPMALPSSPRAENHRLANGLEIPNARFMAA